MELFFRWCFVSIRRLRCGISGIGEGSYLFYDENGDNQVGMNELVLNLGNESDTIFQ